MDCDHRQGVELLERSLGWTRVRLSAITEADLRRPTPCSGWDLAALLRHMNDSLDAFLEATAGFVDVAVPVPSPPPAAGAAGARAALTGKACALLGAWTRSGPLRVAIGAARVDSGVVTATAALEIAVHGWDVGWALGSADPFPGSLARALLPVARAAVTPADRGVRFADALPTDPDAPYGVALLGLLGRQAPPSDLRDGTTGTN